MSKGKITLNDSVGVMAIETAPGAKVKTPENPPSDNVPTTEKLSSTTTTSESSSSSGNK